MYVQMYMFMNTHVEVRTILVVPTQAQILVASSGATYLFKMLSYICLFILVWVCVICMCVHVCVHVPATMFACHSVHVDSQRQLVGVIFPLQSCGFWGLNSVVGLGSQCPYLPAHLFIPTFSLESGSFAGLEFPKQAVPRNYPTPTPCCLCLLRIGIMSCIHPCMTFYVDPRICV